MRRPFLLILILLALYFWLKDFTSILFYLVGSHSAHLNIYSTIISLIIFLAILYTLKITVFKKISLPTIKEIFQPERRKEWLLLLLVSLPLILLGLFRCIYPDENADTVHYELYLQEFDFSENKTNFGAGGLGTYFFPLSQRIIGFSRHLLGYRLGTIFNTFLLFTIVVSSYDFIKKFLSFYAPALKISFVLPALFALYVAFADNTLLIIGSYKTDLIGIPLLLELIHIVLFGSQYSKKITYLVFFILASLIITFKLTFLPFVGILGVIFFIKNLKSLPPALLLSIPFFALLFPSIYLVYNVIETGSPVFPMFNGIFKSPLFPQINFKDGRWGPRTMSEAFYFHIITLKDTTRIGEFQLYSYRFLFGYIVSLGFITFYLLRFKRNKYNLFYKQIAFLCLIALLIDFSWAITTGYPRYGIITEIFYGLILTLLLTHVKEKILSVLLIFSILFQISHTFQNIFVKQVNLSWFYYADLLHNKEARQENIQMFFHDYGKVTDKSNILPKVDAFVTIDPCVHDGLAKLLNKKVPIYDLSANRTEDTIKKFEEKVVRVQSQNKNLMVTGHLVCLETDWVKNINNRGYLITDMYEVYPDFMRANEPAFLFKIRYLDTSKYSIITTSKHVTVGGSSPDSIFFFQTNRKMKVFIREAAYAFGYPLNIYDLYVNDKKYTINSKSKDSKIISLETDSVTLKANQPKTCLVIFQEIEEKRSLQSPLNH